MLRTRWFLGILAVGLVATSRADAATFITRPVTEPVSGGLTVTGPLSGYVVTSNARVLVPTAWTVRSQKTSLRLRTTQNPSCHYTVTYRASSTLDAPENAADRAARLLPAQGARYVLDSGVRGSRAFRVIRTPGLNGRVRVRALWTGVLTKRADIAPAGKVAWTQIAVDAVSTAGDECHAGTWRESLGPSIGDSLATARVRLHFTKRSV